MGNSIFAEDECSNLSALFAETAGHYLCGGATTALTQTLSLDHMVDHVCKVIFSQHTHLGIGFRGSASRIHEWWIEELGTVRVMPHGVVCLMVKLGSAYEIIGILSYFHRAGMHHMHLWVCHIDIGTARTTPMRRPRTTEGHATAMCHTRYGYYRRICQWRAPQVLQSADHSHMSSIIDKHSDLPSKTMRPVSYHGHCKTDSVRKFISA